MTKPTEKKIYFIGIEGAGTSALSVMYKNLGYEVLGSDDGDHFYADILKKNKIKTFKTYNEKNLPKKIYKVIYSTSIKDNNVEIIESKKRKLDIKSYPESLAELFNEKMGIAVCGTHGKTTITAMLAFVANKIGLNPKAIVGSKVINWGENSLTGNGEYFIIEADEYQNKLKYYNPWSAILTSVDYDHPDFYKTFKDYKRAFADFTKKIPKYGNLIYCNDDRDVSDVVSKANCQKNSYGFMKDSNYRITNYKSIKQTLEVFYQKKSLGNFKIKLFGRHNALNATAVIAFCHKLGMDISEVKKALALFKGTARRFEKIGEKNGAILIDDYAHHPEEVKATLKTVKEIFPEKNIITVFHPHSFSRTERLLKDFANSFSDTDELIILDIYGSAREDSGKVSSKNLVNLINKYSSKKARYISKIEKVTRELKNSIGKNDVIISMGAGNVWQVTHKLIK